MHRLAFRVRGLRGVSAGRIASASRWLLAILLLASLAASRAALVRADGGWTAYNDCVWESPQPEANITKYTLTTGSMSGPLVNYATGTPTVVTATLTVSGKVNVDETRGKEAASGTDAFTTFNGRVSSVGILPYGAQSSWYVDLTFTGLDASKGYTFATTANAGASAYAGRITRFVLNGAEHATNASTPGVTVTDTYTVTFDTGDNTANGYVARWTGIRPGSDGSFSVRARAHVTSGMNAYQAYAFSVFMLQEEPTNRAPDAPALVQPQDQATDVSVAPTLEVTVSDPDGDAMDVTFHGRRAIDGEPFAPLSVATDIASGENASLSWPDLLHKAEYEWYAVVSDGTDATTGPIWTFTTAAAPNTAPVLAPIGNQSVDELTPLSFTAAADDDVGDVLTFALTGAPLGATIAADTGAFSWTPAEEQGPGMYPMTVTVCDDGDPSLCDSEEIEVTVGEVNVAPVLAPIDDKDVNELDTLAFAAAATDADLPSNVLTYSLDGAPAGTAIDAQTGVFTWMPTEAQGPDEYTFSVCVDDGELGDCEEITVTVNEVNSAPELDAIGDRTGSELTPLSFTATAMDGDLPANTLTYRLDGAPLGATIDAQTGVFTWTPTEEQGPGAYTFFVCAGDGTLDDCEEITVTVNEVNAPPELATISDHTIPELSSLSFTATATDVDLPSNVLTYSLEGAPAGAIIDPDSGVFSWTPSEAQGPGAYPFTVRVCDEDEASCDEEALRVTVNEVNEAPVLAPIGDRTVDELATLAFVATATDDDVPANTLSYGLVGAPAGATINALSGAFSWTPTEAQGPGVYTFNVRAYDDGDPLLYDEEVVTVTVHEVAAQPAPSADLRVTLQAEPGEVATGDPLTYTVRVANDGAEATGAVTVTVDLPAGAAFGAAAGGGWTCVPDDGAVTCRRGALIAGDEAPDLRVRMMVAPDAAGTMRATATVVGDVDDPDPTNNIATIDVVVQPREALPTFRGYLPFVTGV